MSRVHRLSGVNGYRPVLREVMENAPTGLPRCPLNPDLPVWDKRAIRERLMAALRDHFGRSNTAGNIGREMRRNSDYAVNAWLDGRNTPTLDGYCHLVHLRGTPFHNQVMGLPPEPDRDELIKQVEFLKHLIRKI